MTIERLLNSIGKATFIKYYYSFKNQSREYCIINFSEEFTDKAKSTRTGHAQKIFRDGLEKEDLIIIAKSYKVSPAVAVEAKEILKRDFLYIL